MQRFSRKTQIHTLYQRRPKKKRCKLRVFRLTIELPQLEELLLTGNPRPAQEGLSLLPWCAASRGVKSPGAPVWNTMGSLAKHFTASKTGLSYGNNITGQTVLDTKPVGREDSGKRTAERFSLAGSGDEKVPEHPPHLLSEQTNQHQLLRFLCTCSPHRSHVYITPAAPF